MFQKNVRIVILGLIGFGGAGWASVAFAQRAVDHYVEQDRVHGCPNCGHEVPRLDIYGWRGTPYYDEITDGCRCGKKSGLTYYNAYHHWTSPASFLLDHGRKGCAWRKGSDTTKPRFRDALDRLAKVRLLPPIRKDNGLCGPQCDPYGLVGASRRGVTVAPEPQAPVESEQIIRHQVAPHPIVSTQNDARNDASEAMAPQQKIGYPIEPQPVASRQIVPQQAPLQQKIKQGIDRSADAIKWDSTIR